MAATFIPERFGQYVLLSHLGRGGMADVYKARVEGVAGFARNVVVKRILKIHTEEPHFVEMFINEAKIASRLSHPNIAQVYELGEVDGELFMAMEYVRGQDLLRVMRAAAAHGEVAPPAPVGAYIVREIAKALAHAHEHIDENGAPRPIIHRDVSPQNVMIGYDGQVKLVDFGIAKAVTAFHEVTHTGSLKGKFGYMAPEQIDTGMCTPQTDVFSAGVVLHEVLTGRRLFKGQTDYDTMTKVKSAPMQPPSTLNPQIHPTLDRITMTALERDPVGRYQRAALLVRELDEYLLEMRFSSEDMSGWLRRVIPPAEREDAESQALHVQLPDRPGTPSRSSSSASAMHKARRIPSLAHQSESLGDLAGVSLPAAEMHSRPSQGSASQPGPQAPSGAGRRGLLILLIGGVFFGSLGSVLFILRSRPAQQGEAQLQRPAVPPVATGGAPAERPAPPSRLQLDSDPTGASVYVGPRRLGQTPLPVQLDGESLGVVLSFPGRPDLSYTIRRADGGELMLRLPEPLDPRRKDGRRRDRKRPDARDPAQGDKAEAQATPVSAPAAPDKQAPKRTLKVKIVDEDERPGAIKSLDD